MKKIWDLKKKSSVTWRLKNKGMASSLEWHAYFSWGHFTTKLFTVVYRNLNNTVVVYKVVKEEQKPRLTPRWIFKAL